MESISVVADGWAAHEVGRALTFWDRWRGLKGHRHPALLIRTRSVHGFGLRSPLLAVGISARMEVTSVRRLRPGHVVHFPGAKFVLELPPGSEAPRVGSTVEIRDG
ncbi:MAG: hypothetical protein ACRDVL_04015 [Acidimicrobiia bacterium]